MAQNGRQYFYLVVCNYDEITYPRKVFLQEHEAITWGRKQATKALKRGDSIYEYVLFKQEIARTATLIRVRTLEPYRDSQIQQLVQKVEAAIKAKALEPFDWDKFEQKELEDC